MLGLAFAKELSKLRGCVGRAGTASGVMAAGAKGFVQKPYDMRQLLSTVREVLDKDVTGHDNG